MWTFMHSKFHFHMSVLGWKLLLRWFFPLFCVHFVPLLLPLFLCHISHSSVSSASYLFPIYLPTLPRASHPVKRRSSFSFSLLEGWVRGCFQLERERRQSVRSVLREWQWEEWRWATVAWTHISLACGGRGEDVELWSDPHMLWKCVFVRLACENGLRMTEPRWALSIQRSAIFGFYTLHTASQLVVIVQGWNFPAQEVLLRTRCWVQRKCYRCQIAAVGICSISITQPHNTNPTSAQNLQTLQIAMTTAAVPTC